MMKSKFLISLYITVLVSPIAVGAKITPTQATSTNSSQIVNELQSCKEKALHKKEKYLASAKHDLTSKLNTITEKYTKNQQKANWFIRSSFLSESKKIVSELSKETATVTNSYKKSVNSSYMTWKAEDSLCDHLYGKATTTQKSSAKKKK